MAGAERGLTTSATLARFALGHSGSAANAARALLEDDRLVRAEGGSGYDFDSPFLRGWVVRNALPDVGIRLPATHRAAVPADDPEITLQEALDPTTRTSP